MTPKRTNQLLLLISILVIAFFAIYSIFTSNSTNQPPEAQTNNMRKNSSGTDIAAKEQALSTYESFVASFKKIEGGEDKPETLALLGKPNEENAIIWTYHISSMPGFPKSQVTIEKSPFDAIVTFNEKERLIGAILKYPYPLPQFDVINRKGK